MTQFLRWKVISAFDIFIELGVVAMSVFLVWDLRQPLATKATVVGAFALRLPYDHFPRRGVV